MRLATSVVEWIIRLTAVTQLAVGLLFWSGRAGSLLNLHMMVGLLFVIALWVLALLAWRTGLGAGPTLLVVAWGFVIPVFGMVHPRIMPGPDHWIIRVVHLLIGVAAMAMAAKLGAFIRRRAERVPATAGIREAA
jgi:hypothetical protein